LILEVEGAMRVLVAGATGRIGREVVRTLAADGHAIRTFSRDPERASELRAIGAHDVHVGDASVPGTLAGTCDAIDVVCSAMGASVSASALGMRSYADVDRAANLALLAEAVRAGVRRFVYVGVHTERGYADTAYIRAHRDVEDAVRASGLEHGFVRPTGLHGTLLELLELSRRGVLPVFGDGSAKTNPVHEADVAAALVAAAVAPGSTETSAGGPDVLTRREIAELAFTVRGATPRIVKLPLWAAHAGARATTLVDRRLGEFLAFAALVSTTDCVAPVVGERRLRDSFAAAA
jgi:uncharacterized protein YbjT (DUF2867 family)